MRKLALIGIVGIFCLVVLSAMSKDEPFGAERFYLGDLVSKYGWYETDGRYPDGTTFKVSIRYQHTWTLFSNPVIQLFPVVGRFGQTVYTCENNCEGMPELREDVGDNVSVLNRWHGVWYCIVDRGVNASLEGGSPYLVGKGDKGKWVEISREEFPLELLVKTFGPSPLDTKYLKRDSTRSTFSESSDWLSHKILWYYMLKGVDVHSFEGIQNIFPDSVAFPFFQKHIQPHWKFESPVLDRDFTPYEGMDPGQIPFPDEVGNK